ncbi:unnamed protein product [Diabrotica balteata]|uniref:acid phosphatase n=1 Tax=Diabrotica balteata TaxID=107213 RepID=A0A9P0E2B5_DIABA|nr:unnamed protein product [Diabrotica balteata]
MMNKYSSDILIKLSVVLFIAQSTICIDASPLKKQTKSELLAVTLVMRHGDRSPMESFPNDKHFNAKNFPLGAGQLTKPGIIRLYALGKWFRNQYKDFLSDAYKPSEILVRSTDTDRSIMSASTVLAGMYPPHGDQIWNNNLLWQPIPVYSENKEKDDILVEKRPCKLRDQLYNQAKSENYPLLKERHSDIFKQIANYSGYTNVSLYQVEVINNLRYVYTNFNKSFIPDWIKRLNFTELDHLGNTEYTLKTLTPTQARLQTGPFFYSLIEHFDKFSNKKDEQTPKFRIISAHDSTIINILDVMGAYDFRKIGFCDTIIYEFRKSKEGQFFITIYLKQEDKLHPLTAHRCSVECRWDDFKQKMSNVTIDIINWKRECDSV